MAEITVDVGVRLKAMQSSVADLQKVLDGLQPNSSGFKALQKIITDINRDIDRLRIQTSKPFGSQNQFSQTEKTVDKLEESLEKVKITIDRIKFSDLKLDSSQTAQLDNFKQQLKDIKQEFTDFKADLKGQFLDNDFNKAFVEGINPNLLNKNFDEIVKNVNNKVDNLGLALARAKTELENFQNATKIGEKLSKASKATNGIVSQDFMGQELFDKFFQTNSKGIFSFKTGGGLKKGEIQQQFLNYLTEEFQLTQTQVDQLKNQTASNIRKILAQDDFFNPQKKAAETANKKMSGAESTFTNASKDYENAAAVVARLTPLLSALSNEELSLEDKQKLVNQAIRQFEQDCVNGAKGSKTLQDSTKGLSSGLESFKQQLGQVNTQWLNLQKQQATFNSMKSAIVNFMGFNQVLNLTKKAVKEAMNHIKQLDTTMNGIAIVTNMTTADLWKQVDVYSEMAQRYGTSIQGAYEVSKIYYQAGYETNEVLTLMNETLKMSKISGLDYATTTDYMMNAIKGFKMEVADAASVVDVYSALAANTAVSQQELAEAMSKTASSMAGVGSTFEDTSAMIATMVSVTRESANNIGSAMKSIASRYGELTKDPTKLLDAEGEAMSFNKVDTALKSVGITLQTTDHQFRDFTDVIVELAEKWDTLDSAQQRYIATQFAGNRQQNRFLALVSNKDLLKENMDVAAASEDTGTLQALKALDSLESKLNQVQVAYQQFYTTIGIENVWKAFLDGTENVINTLNNLPKLFGKIPVGAIAVIYDIISLIKTAALNGLSEIASIWQNNIQKVAQTDVNTRPVGDKMVDGVLEGIKGRAEEIRTAFSNATDMKKGQGMIERSSEYQSVLENSDIAMVGTIAFNEEDAKFLSSDLDTIISKMLQFNDITEDTGIKLRAALSKGDYKGVAEEIEKISFSLKETGEKLTSIQANSSGLKNFLKTSKHLSSDMAGFASALNMIGTLLNTTSREGQIASGSLMGLSGAFRLGSVAVQAFQGTLNGIPWMAIATGIISIINGISTFIETPTEKLERLTKEAESLNNEAKQAKAEYNTLQRTADKLDELKEKRYDSAEAAEEYQSAVDDLASKFPQLVAGFDEAGNIIIDTTTSEATLAEARQKTLQATLEAAKAEYERRKEETKQSQKDLNRGQSAIEDHQEFLRAHGENNTDWIREYINLDLNSPNAGQDVQKLIDSYYNLNENLQDKYSQIVKNLQDWVKASNDTFNYQDLENSSKKQLLSAQALANENYSKLGASQAIFTNYLFEQSDIIDENGIALTIFNEKEQAYYDALEKANIDLVNGGERYDKYIQMMNNLNQYSIADWGDFFENNTNNEAYLAIIDYYKNVYHFSDNLKNKILTSFSAEKINENDGVKIVFDTEKNNNIRISKLYSAINTQKEKISGDLYNWLLAQIDVIKSFGQQGYIKAGNTLTNQISAILTEDLSQMEEGEASLVFSILKQYDISTIEGLAKAKQALQNASVGEELFDNFDEIEKELVYNIPLAIQSYTQDLVSNVNTIGEKMKKASSGFDGNEALEVLDSLQASGYEKFDLADFSMEKNGKFVIKNQEMRQAYFDSLLKEQEAISSALDARLENLKNDDVKKNLGDLVKKAAESEDHIINKESLGDYESIFRSLGWLEETTDGQLKLTETYLSQAKEKGFNLLEALDKWLAGALKNSVATEEFLQKTLPAEEALSAGDYQTYLRTLTGNNLLSLRTQHLEQIAKTGAYGNLDYKTEIKPLKDKINSVYNNLISDALSKGLDNIRPEDYEGLIDDSFDAGEEGPHRYEEFIRRYADLAGKSITETNALIIQAIEKDTQTTTGAAKDAISKLSWGPGARGFGSLSDIQALADSFNVPIDSILGEYNKELNQYSFDASNLDLTSIDNFSETVRDSIAKFIKDSFSNATKAITGKLTSSEAVTFKGQLDVLGLKGFNLDFTRTTDGLKLSKQSAIELYNELKNIDALQAQLVFSELSKSLQENDANYANISTTLARIAELENEIKEMKPDDARLQMYKDELSVAQEIARTRSSTDNKDFNFMDRALPTGMQNPIDYWNSTGEAFKAMNNAAKTGKMEIQDFYNIVQEMNNMAAVSGQTLQFMGQSLNGKAEDAASLIQAGFSALTNVKGDGVKIALGNIGTDFTTGAEAMKGDFDDGVRSMAKAQISMLDAAINMLEAIVAMEDIDIDSDGFLSDIEIFNDDGTFTTNVENWLTKLDTLTGGIEIGGVDLKTALLNMANSGEEGKQKVIDLLNELYNIDWSLGDTNVFGQVQTVLSQYFSGLTITQNSSIFDALQVPKNADKNTKEFTDWVTKSGLAAEKAEALIAHLETGNDIWMDSLHNGTGDKTSYLSAIENLLGLEKQNQKDVLEQFAGKDNKLTQEEITLFSGLDINWEEDGELKEAIYTASDGSQLPLSKDASNWQNEIKAYEDNILINKHVGNNNINEGDSTHTTLTTVTLSSGVTVDAAIEANQNNITAYYQGQSAIFNNMEEAKAWIKEQAELNLYHIGETGGATTKINTETNEVEIIPVYKITGEKTPETEQSVEKLLNMTGAQAQEYVNNLPRSKEGKIVIPDIPIEFEEGTDASYIQQVVDQYFGNGTFDTLPGKIAEGIKTAFTQDTSISEAIGEGIRIALAGEEGKTTESLPISISSITLTTGEGFTITGEEEIWSQVITEDNFDFIANVLSLVTQKGTTFTNDNGTSIWDLVIKENSFGFIANVLSLITQKGTNFTNDNGQTIWDLVVKENPYNFIAQVISLITEKGENFTNDNGQTIWDLVKTTPDQGYTFYAEVLSLITSQGETFTNDDGQSIWDLVITQQNFSAFTAWVGSLITSQGENFTNDKGQSIWDLVISQKSFPAFLASVAGIITQQGSNFTNDNGETIWSQVKTEKEKDFIVKVVSLLAQLQQGVQLNTSDILPEGDINLGTKKGVVEIGEIEYKQPGDKARREIASLAREDNMKGGGYSKVQQTFGKKTGALGLGTLKANEEAKEYVNIVQEMVDAGQQLSKTDYSNLLTLSGAFQGDTEFVKQINSIITNSDINADNLNSLGNLAQSFSDLEVGQLPEIATALKDIADQAEILAGIEWDKIVEGIQNVTSAQAGKPQEGGENKGGGPSTTSTPTSTTDLLSTSSLATAVAEIDSVIESFTSAAEQINAVVSAMGEIKTDNIDDLADAANDIKSTYAENARNAINGISSTNATMAKTAINNISAAGAISAKEAINNISGEISLGINISVNMPQDGGGATGNVDIHSVSSGSATRSSATSVKWSHTHAYAAGNTLMGELGPELVVSNGRYFLVGQSGPEMVNLAEDAIVFNHLQTQQLLKHGKASKYATPVTNERKATSLATGNAGPAMASASDALATLKQLRSMWQSLLDASLQDMGSMGGGSGGGGGGGGGGSSDTEKYVAGITSNVERWYNWLTAIETTQNKINILTKKYNLLSEQGASSKKLADNLGKQYDQLQKSYNIRKQLTKEQKAYQKSLQKDIKSGKSALSAFYQVGEDGSLLLAQDSAFSKYVSKHSTLSKSDRAKIAAGKTVKMTVKKQQAYTAAEAEEYNTKYAEDIKKGTKTKVSAGDLKESTKKTTINVPTSGLELMKELQKTDKYGNLVYSAKEQYSILKKLGFEDYMSKDASGQAIDTSTDEGKATAVESFLSRISADKEEYESITKSIQEQEEAALEERLQMEEINKQLIEMAKPVQGVTEALEHWYNWTRKIVAAQTELTLLGTKYNQLQSQLGDNTDKTLENLEEQIEKTREILSGTQKEREERQTALDERRKAIEESGSYDRLYTFDEKTGSLVYRDKVNGGNNEAVTTVGGPWEPELKAIEEFGEKGAKIVPQKLGDESIATLEDVSNQATQIATDSSNTLFTITEKSIRTTEGGYARESGSLLEDLKTQQEEDKLGTLSSSEKKLLKQLNKTNISEKAWKKLSKEQQAYYTKDGNGNYVLNTKGKNKKNKLKDKDEETLYTVLGKGMKDKISSDDYKKLSTEQKKYFVKNKDGTYSINASGRKKYNELYSRQTSYDLAEKAKETYKEGITKEQRDEAQAKIKDFKETDFQKTLRAGTSLTQAEYDKLSSEQKKYYSKGTNGKYSLSSKGYSQQKKLQEKYDQYEFYKQIVDAYDTSRIIYDTEEKQVELNTEDPREFLKQLTAKDGNDNSVFTKEQQAEILVQAGYKEQLRHFNGKSYNLEDPEELAQAAADWLEYIQSVPEAYNEALDEMEATKQKEEELKQQILDYNNQIRELLKPTAGVTAQLESWYKWTRQTIDAQKKLNLLTTEYSNLEKSIGDTTKEQVKNLIDQGKQNKIERDANKNEQAAKKAKWEQEVAKVTNNKALGQFLNYDKETETVRYSDTAISGLDLPKTISVNEIKRDKTGREIRINTDGDEITFGQEGYDDERNKVASEKKEYDLSKILGDAINKEGKIDPQKFIENLTQTDEAGNAIYSLELQSAVLEALGITGQDLTIFGDFENWEEANANQRKAAIQAFLEYMPEAAEKVNGLKDAYADSVIEGANLDGQLLDINNDLQKLAEIAAGIQNPFEEWHSWIVKIKREQNELNLLSKEYSNNEKERTNNGEKLGDQLIKQLEIYKEQKDTQNAYKEAQEKEYNNLINTDNWTEAQKRFFSVDENNKLIYNNEDFAQQVINQNGIKLTGTVDKNGVYEYKNVDEKINFKAEGAEDFLKKLTEQDAFGNMQYNTDEQFAILEAFGFSKLMQYDQSGNKIFANGIDNATKEEREAAVKAVLDNLLNFQTTVEKAEDQIQQTSETLVDIDGNIIGIKNQIQDNEITLENKVLQAIEDREQKQIDVLQKQKDMLSEAADNFLNGLSDQLSKEREMYEKQETQDELLKMQRQLAILQRSGGSASQIRGLQEQIRTQQKDMYFDERQEQIDAIKEASDKQIEKLDRQIKIAEESLTYAKENGLYWNEVREIMKQDSDAILSFIELNLAERKSQSTLQSGLEILKDGKIVGTFTSIREHPFKEGGLVNFTGPAWLDGTKKKPESVLTADQTNFLRNKLIDDLELFSLAISQFADKVTLSNSLNNLNENTGINIEQLDFVMQVESLANDYDARRAGQQAFEEMVRIARKAGNHSISRR